jgi:hypothetical protein
MRLRVYRTFRRGFVGFAGFAKPLPARSSLLPLLQVARLPAQMIWLHRSSLLPLLQMQRTQLLLLLLLLLLLQLMMLIHSSCWMLLLRFPMVGRLSGPNGPNGGKAEWLLQLEWPSAK